MAANQSISQGIKLPMKEILFDSTYHARVDLEEEDFEDEDFEESSEDEEEDSFGELNQDKYFDKMNELFENEEGDAELCEPNYQIKNNGKIHQKIKK